jgi:hypothetical protein
MRIPTLAFPLTVLLLAATAQAGSNTNYLVPAYQPCAPEVNNCPAVLESTFTFESARFKAASSPYLKDDQLAIAVELKGVRDQAGALVITDPEDPDDDFRLIVPASQITLFGITYPPGNGPSTDIVLRIELKNGKGKASYKTPAGGEGSGVVAEAGGIPYVVDSTGNRFAVSGSRDKPAN